jgi:heme oxygenase
MNQAGAGANARVPEELTGRAALVREATAPQHRNAETRSFITALMGGELSLAAYTAYLAQYAYVYRALEARTPRDSDPAIIADSRLARFAVIEADLAALGASDWEAEHPALPATAAYVARLNAIADDLPRYVAHHYTRYLGDLSGGQAIAALVARHYGATEEQLSFYRFDGIDSPVTFKREYRAGLDALDFDSADDAAFVDEAKSAFGYNAAIFEALDDLTRRTPVTAA